jgi:catechol 2,3-dioxygenase-like lactoylglutathione lyase family enzyme
MLVADQGAAGDARGGSAVVGFAAEVRPATRRHPTPMKAIQFDRLGGPEDRSALIRFFRDVVHGGMDEQIWKAKNPKDHGVSLDFYEQDEGYPQHYAFLVEEDEFDPIFARIRERGLEYWADPARTRPGEINRNDGGRGVYFRDPDDHLFEIITRPTGAARRRADRPRRAPLRRHARALPAGRIARRRRIFLRGRNGSTIARGHSHGQVAGIAALRISRSIAGEGPRSCSMSSFTAYRKIEPAIARSADARSDRTASDAPTSARLIAADGGQTRFPKW